MAVVKDKDLWKTLGAGDTAINEPGKEDETLEKPTEEPMPPPSDETESVEKKVIYLRKS